VIIPSAKYPSQIDVTDLSNYPQGKARNVTASGDNTGTPFEKSWINDWFGFQQAAVVAAGITPSGSPDTVIASDLLNAVRQISYQRMIGAYFITGLISKNDTQLFPLTTNFQSGSFILASDQVQVPEPGKYKVTFTGLAMASSAANPSLAAASVKIGGTTTAITAACWRYSTITSNLLLLRAEGVVAIATPSSQGIGVVCDGVNGIQFSNLTNSLIIERVG
jgi:hypothetical protein